MIIYLIKLILILVFNTCVNTYYIYSGCKCCCGNSKSGEIGSGSKTNLGTNPSISYKPILGPNIGGTGGSGSKGNLGPNLPISIKSKPGDRMEEMRSGSNGNLGPNPILGPKLIVGDHMVEMRSVEDGEIKNIVNLTKIILNADETIQYNELTTNQKVENEETKGIVNGEFKDCIFYSINAELYDSITEESNIQFVNNISNNSDKYILFAVKTTSNNTYVGYCTDGNSKESTGIWTGLFDSSKINKEFKMISCGRGICNMYAMFYWNESLNEVIFLKGFNTSEVIDMSNMFDGCRKLEKLALSKLNSKKVKKIFAMFRRCESLQELNLTNFNNNCSIVKHDDDDIFHNCVKLLTIKTSNKQILEEFNNTKENEKKNYIKVSK